LAMGKVPVTLSALTVFGDMQPRQPSAAVEQVGGLSSPQANMKSPRLVGGTWPARQAIC
jgi:hypothetical protein